MKKNFILTFIFGLLVSNLFSQITISTTTTRCTGANANTYTLSGNLTFSSPPATGYLTVSVEGGHSQVFNAPFTSPLSYSIQKLIADGATRNVTATFSATGTTGSNSFTAPSSVGTGFSNFPINTVVTNLLWGTSPYPQQSWNNGYVPGYGGPIDFGGGIHDLDLTPPGVTDIAAVCGELAEGIAGGAGSNYYNTYRYVPLEYLARGTASEVNESQNIPIGGIGMVRAGMLRFLFDTYYTSTNANSWTVENGAAFQLAVWEIIHEKYTSNTAFSVKTASTNGFYFLATYNLTSLNLAETYVAAVNAKNWTDAQWMAYQPVNWHVIAIENNSAYGGNDAQDLVIAQPIVCTACTPPTLGGATSVCVGSTATVTPTSGGTWASSNPAIATVTNAGVVTGVTPGTVTLTFTNSNNCSNTMSFTVNSLPTITGTTPGTRCGAGTVTLGATASAGTVNWYNTPTGGTLLGTGTSFTTPSITTTTTYYVDATSNGCTTSTRTAVIATVNPLPTVHIASINNVCSNQTPITLYATPIGGTFSGAGVTGNLFNPATAGVGTHTVTYSYTDAQGCTASTSTTIIVLDAANSFAITPSTLSICSGQSASFTASGNNGGTVNWTANMMLPSASGITYNTGIMQNLGASPYNIVLTATVQTGNCITQTSATLTVLPEPRVIVAPSKAVVCYYEIPHFTLNSVIPGTTINWQLINNATLAVVTSGSGLDSVSLFGTTFATGSYTLKVTGTKDGCTSVVTNVSLIVN